MPYEQIHACPNGCVLFRKQHAKATHCPKCKSSRYLEVDTRDGGKKQLTIPVKILRYLPFIPRIQRLYMTEAAVNPVLLSIPAVERLLAAHGVVASGKILLCFTAISSGYQRECLVQKRPFFLC